MAKKIAFDFQSIKNRIVQNLSSKSEWATFLSYGTIDNLIDCIANELSYEIQYSEYNTMENWWNLARNRSSLLQMSPMHGYIVPRKRASVGTLRISASKNFDTPYSKNIIIPKYFQFNGGGLYVCAHNNYILASNENYKDIDCIQGESKEVSFLAEGFQYEEKIIYDDSIENDFFTLTVNGIEWKCVDSLFSYNSNDQVYQIITLNDLSGIQIRFGNDVFGKKLSKNDEVVFKYISTKGSDGNIYSTNIIKSVKSQAFDSSGESVKLYCTNLSTFVGGNDYPSIDEIRELSPKVYQTGDRASSKNDYETILKTLNYVGKVSVWGAYEYLIDHNLDPWGVIIPSDENVVHFAILDSNYQIISENQKKMITEILHEICDPTTLFKFETPNTIPMIFHINATLSSLSYTTAEIESKIQDTLMNTYGLNKMNFGDDVYDSDYIRLIDEIPGIDNLTSYIELYKEMFIFTESYYGTFELPIHPIEYSSVKFYIKDISLENSEYEEFANCDANGNIIGLGTYITTDSFLNLDNGKGNLLIHNVLTSDYHNYLFKISYQYIERNIKNENRANVLYYDNAEIELNYNI